MNISEKLANEYKPNSKYIDEFLKLPDEELFTQAESIKMKSFGSLMATCAIINARSGLCSEDCSFCAQSAHYSTDAPEYPFIDLKRIDEAAKSLAEKGVERFSIVMSGKGPTEDEFQKLKEGIGIIVSHGLLADASVGILSREQLIELKDAGMSAYHHNLETSRSFFPEVCTTHSYEEDVRAVRDSVELGLYVCSGGIFGLGESWMQRAELAYTLKELGVQSVPVNFLTPIPGTPAEGKGILDKNEALRITALMRMILPDRHIRICGGRNAVFGSDDSIMHTGASGLMVGDYLTIKGVSLDEDMEKIKKLSE
ncbi:biotin synthase BioB [Limisalsivibrio acetivorans]|uniref:biotin synthase BioB n=1 Tax=Limisalsivibrio acetivorans TaxID=1304888 RepID=UPI0003B4DE65|nr:biotin synthase BioB [Limisalsivibrio acetivorans]